MPSSSELRAARKTLEEREGFNADERTARRERTPVVIDGVTFTRRKKDWSVSRQMRLAMREQEKALALSNRVKARVAELEVKQAEAAAEGNDDLETELEGKIDELVRKADDATEDAEVSSYRLLALLLIPPAGDDAPALRGFGPKAAGDDEAAVQRAVEWLQPRLDVEDAAALATELSGSREPDPTTTPSSENGSSS